MRTALEQKEKYTEELGVTLQGVPHSLPRYYRKKIGLKPDDFKDLIWEKECEMLSFFIKAGITEDIDIDKEILKGRLQVKRQFEAKRELFSRQSNM